jgi:hypothetical protein
VCNLTVGGSGAASAGMTATLTVSPPAFFANEVSVGGGAFYLQFPGNNLFGYFAYVSSSVVYHYDMGYEAAIPDASNGVYLYDYASSHWFYTTPGSFPSLYDFTLNSWIYYFPSTGNPGHYSSNPRYFLNFTTNKFFTM